MFDDVVHLLFRAVNGKTESDGPVGSGKRNAHGPEDMEGSSEPDVHAEPEEAQMPRSERRRRIDSPSTYSKLAFKVFGSRLTRSPLMRVFGIFSKSFASR